MEIFSTFPNRIGNRDIIVEFTSARTGEKTFYMQSINKKGKLRHNWQPEFRSREAAIALASVEVISRSKSEGHDEYKRDCYTT